MEYVPGDDLLREFHLARSQPRHLGPRFESASDFATCQPGWCCRYLPVGSTRPRDVVDFTCARDGPTRQVDVQIVMTVTPDADIWRFEAVCAPQRACFPTGNHRASIHYFLKSGLGTNRSGGCPAIKCANSGKTENGRTLRGKPLSQLVDALHIAIAEKLSGLRPVRDAVGIESQIRHRHCISRTQRRDGAMSRSAAPAQLT